MSSKAEARFFLFRKLRPISVDALELLPAEDTGMILPGVGFNPWSIINSIINNGKPMPQDASKYVAIVDEDRWGSNNVLIAPDANVLAPIPSGQRQPDNHAKDYASAMHYTSLKPTSFSGRPNFSTRQFPNSSFFNIGQKEKDWVAIIVPYIYTGYLVVRKSSLRIKVPPLLNKGRAAN